MYESSNSINKNNNNNNNNDNDNDNDNEGVAIIGLGFRIPSGENSNLDKLSKYTTNQLWNNLMNKFDGVVSINERWSENFYNLGEISTSCAGLIPLDEWKSFDPLFFGINPSEAPTIEPQQRLLLKCVWEALEDAKIDPIKVRGTNTSVFIGSSTMDYKDINIDHNRVYTNMFGSIAHSISNRISYCFDFKGQSITLDTACSSSLNAIQLGCTTILNGTSNISVVGGVNLLLEPQNSKSTTYLNMLSKTTGRCNAFDASADGFVRGEGAGVVVLKSLKQAIKDSNTIYCVIKGSSSNVDGNGLSDKSNFFSPSSLSQAENIRLALESTKGSVNPSDVDYVEAHGTGTPTGDPVELEGISMVFKDHRSSSPTSTNPLLIGSIKSNIGHLESASGVASLIKCCLMFKNQCFAPNINFKTPNPSIKFDEWKLKVVTEPIPFDSNKQVSMIINNFGVTGSNCCLVLSQFKQPQQQQPQQQQQSSSLTKLLIPFSANSAESLSQYQSLMFDNNFEDSKFSEFVYQQIQHKSTSLYQRSVIIASDWKEFKDGSNQIKTTSPKPSNILLSSSYCKKNPITVFVFCGQGSQYNTMALELYNNNQIFKQSMDLIDCKLSKYYGYSVLEKLRSIKDSDNVSVYDSIIAQPSTCMVQISLFELYKHWGIEPSFIIGHSLGEITTAYISGMIDLDTFCYVVYHRSVLQSSTNGCGKMLSISCSADEYKSLYSTRFPSIEIACYNSPTSIVIAGNEQQLTEISKELKEKGVFTAMLGSLSSFHTNSQLVIKDQILNLQFKSVPPSIPIFSTTTSNLLNSDYASFDSSYIFENIKSPVYFTQTISNLYKHIEANQLGNEIVFIEIAPHPTLAYNLKQMVPTKKSSNYFKDGEFISVYSPLHKKKNDIKEFNQTIANLYCQNRYNINFKCQQPTISQQSDSNIQLPLYQWDDQVCWRETPFHHNRLVNGPPMDHLGLINETSPVLKSYQSFIDINRVPFQYLKGHVVKNKFFFPGCGYISNILKIYPSQDIIIDNLEFKTPLIFMDGVSQCLQTNIYQTGKIDYKVHFHFKDNRTKQWINCSSGNFQLVNHDTTNDTKWLDIQDIIQNQCNLTKLSKNELYQYIKMKTGLTYSGYFQSVDQVYLGDGYSLSIVSTKQPPQYTTSSFFNISILDCCLHGMIGLIDEKCQLVFEKVEGFKYYSSNVPTISADDQSNDFIYVYSKFNSREGDSYSASITATLMDGTILFEIENTVCRSLTPVKESLLIEYPTNELYTPYQQSIESLIPSPTSDIIKSLYINNQEATKRIVYTPISVYQQFIPRLFLSNINSRNLEITLRSINSSTIDQLKQKYCNSKHQRLFEFVFESIKQYIGICPEEEDINITLKSLEQWDQSNINMHSLFMKTTKIISKLLFPLENEDSTIDTPQSLIEDGILDSFYNNQNLVNQHELVCDIIQECITPLIHEKMVFRILEFGGGVCTLSTMVLDRINQLLQKYPNREIDIEYTWSDLSPSFLSEAKNILGPILKTKNNDSYNISIIYKILDLEQPLIYGKPQPQSQQLEPSYYDIILMSNVLHVAKDVKSASDQLYDLLSPNGQLLFIEPTHRSIHNDSVFGSFDQWWTFEDTNIRKDRCTMDQNSWRSLLSGCNFQNIIINETPESSFCFLIQAQKPSLDDILSTTVSSTAISPDKSISSGNENIIIYGNIFKLFDDGSNILSSLGSSSRNISNIQAFKDLVLSSTINNLSTIYFIKPLDEMNLDNFKSITLEYIQINQLLLEHKLNGCKHVLLSLNSTTSNYLASSVIGSFRYFSDISQLKLFSISLDSISIFNDNTLALIKYLTNPTNIIQNELMVKNNKVYYDRFKQELKLKNSFKSSTSFEIGGEDNNSIANENILISLSPNLEYHLDSKQLKLADNEVEVKVLATGINYKDYLVYACLVPPSIINRLNDINKPELGHDFSGIITRVGSEDSHFKIGDQVYGIGYNTTASHVVVNKNQIYYKPSNISHCQAASIPSIYLTNLYGIFKVGELDIQDDETILIHSAAGGIGLSAFEILKWKGHKAPIFATVGSKEKEQYLIEKYGDFITGIYSTNNRNFSDKIKQKLKEIGWKKQGVDLILNTLSSGEYMDANFKCLATKGRIVDLSITHLNYNEYTCNNKFKYNVGYHNIELLFVSGSIISKLLKKLSLAIESGKLNLMPISEFSNSNIKEAIEFINQRKHIGKIVINHDTNILGDLLEKQQTNEFNYSVLKSNYQINGKSLGSNIIITGQSGIALEILKWIVEFGSHCVENIIILSKSSLKWELELLIKRSNNKIKFHFKSIDVGDSELVNNAIDQILLDNPTITNIDSILHYAFSQIACKVNEINMHHMDVSHGAKTMGAINLHNQSIKRGWKLLNFIMASSVTSIIGSEDQCSYVSANCVLDHLSKYRQSIGLPSICINYGSIGSTGFVARNESIEMMLSGEGVAPLLTNRILGSLDLQIQNPQQSTNLVLCVFNFKGIKNKNIPQQHYFNPLYLKFDYQINAVGSINNQINFNNDSNVSSKINDLFLNKVSELLSIEVSKINADIKLLDYGADSLFIVQLKNWIDKEISINIISIQQLQSNTINESIQIIINQLSNNNNIGSGKDEATNETDNNTIELNSPEYWKNEIKLDNLTVNLITKKINRSKATMDTNSIVKRMNENMVVLLTGSTGFLGAYLLWNFIKLPNCSTVYCLIRNKSKSPNPINEIIQNLKHHKLYEDSSNSSDTELLLSKVKAIVGDLSSDQFGLSDQDYSTVSNKVNLIVNSGADIDLKSTYQNIKKVNVNGLKESIKLAATGDGDIKCIVNFSSYSVFFNQSDIGESNDTTPSIDTISKTNNGYIQSKIVAEHLLVEASNLGLPAILFRPPIIFANSNSGIGSNNDMLLLMIQACYALGQFPNDINKSVIASPVDWLAEKTIKIINNQNLWNVSTEEQHLKMNIFNMHGKSTSKSHILKYLETEFNCKGINFNQWMTMVEESKHFSCVKLRSFHDARNFLTTSMPDSDIPTKTKLALESMNSFDDGWFVSSQTIKNHVNHIFNL